MTKFIFSFTGSVSILKSPWNRKVISALFILIVLFNQSIFAQWQWQNPLPQGNILFGSYFLNTNTGWACGDGGTIIKTTNAGNNWTVTSTRTKNSIRSVYFLNANTGYACGLYGTVLKSTNGGNIWDKVILNTTGNLFCIKFNLNNTGFIVGDTGIVFRSGNAGLNWTRKITNVTRTLTSCAINDSVVLAAGLNGTVVRSTDNGENFQVINPNVTNRLFDVMFKDASTAFISGDNGAILRSTNAGLSWSAMSTSTNRWFYSISFGDLSTGFATSDYGNIYRTTNGGLSWIGYGTTTSEFQYSIQAFNVNDVISFGNKGTIIKSTNSGINWSDYSYGFRNSMFGIDFVDKDHGWCCGGQGTVALTTNGGTNWIRIQAAGTNDYLYQIDFVNKNVGYCVGEDGLILKSTNGGLNWNQIKVKGMINGFYTLFFSNENTGWVGGDYGVLLKTVDGGINFSILISDQEYIVNSIDFIDNNTGWISIRNESDNGQIYKTTNGGIEWNVSESNSFNSSIGTINFVNENVGIAYTYNDQTFPGSNSIIITTNGGNNWTYKDIPVGNYVYSVFGLDENNFWAVGYPGFIYHTSNQGASWFTESNNNFNDGIFGVFFDNANSGWVCGTNGLIAKYENPINLISNSNTKRKHYQYKLNQNYPNPFNPNTIINYEIMSADFISLDIYDMLGKKVESLVKEKQSPGSYSVNWDASEYPSGIYFYKLNTSENSDTKRMILLK